MDEVASTPLPSSLALLQCIGSQKAREDSRARAKSGVQNQISVLSMQDLLDGAKLPMLYNTRGVRQDIATLMFKVI